MADGTSTNEYVPVYGYYADAYLRCQILYPESMIGAMTGGMISEMKFYSSSTSVSWGMASFNVKVGVTSATSLSGSWDATSLTQVYNGQLSISGSGEMTVTFSSPFLYTGGNLLVEVNEVAMGDYVSANFYGISSTGASIQGYDYDDWSYITPSSQDFIPKTTFTYLPGDVSCTLPSGLAASNVTSTSADITFSSDGTEWLLNITPAVEGVSEFSLTDTSYSFTDLTANTSYTVQVRNICGTDTSYAATTSFRTACGDEALPFFENFESFNVACWTKIGDGTAAAYNSSSYSHSGSYSLKFSGWQNNIMVLPPFEDSTNILGLSIWMRPESFTNNSCGTFQIGYVTDTADASTFVTLQNYSYDNFSDVEQKIVGFNAVPGDARIALRHTPNSTSWYWFVDDIDVHLANVVICDTLVIHDTITIHDTVNVPYFVHDTLFVHDTVTLYDTVGADLIYHSIELMSRDLTRGMVAGKGVFPEGTAVEIAAVPIRGNKFVRWSDGSTQQIRTVTVDGDISLTASFESLGRVGIDDIMETAFEVSAEQGTIVVKDAMGEGVRVFDVSGRLLYQGRVETEVWRLGVSTSGTYFVQIADSPAQKVVVMR